MASPGRSNKLQHTPIARRLVPIPEAREILGGIGHTTIYDLFSKGELQKVNLGRRSFVVAESIDSYLDRLTAAASAKRLSEAAQPADEPRGAA